MPNKFNVGLSLVFLLILRAADAGVSILDGSSSGRVDGSGTVIGSGSRGWSVSRGRQPLITLRPMATVRLTDPSSSLPGRPTNCGWSSTAAGGTTTGLVLADLTSGSCWISPLTFPRLAVSQRFSRLGRCDAGEDGREIHLLQRVSLASCTRLIGESELL